MILRSWIEIDLNKLQSNYLAYKGYLKDFQEIIAVVKADAYGHGDVQVAKKLEEIGVKHFAVATIEEGVKLRKNGIVGTILVLSHTPICYFSSHIKYDIIQTVVSEEYADCIIRTKLPIKTQIAIDTGMNRIGFCANDEISCGKIINEYAKKLNVVGIFTHLSCADQKRHRGFTLKQIERFKKVLEVCKEQKFMFIHCLNSIGGLSYNKDIFNHVRLGVMLYGLYPNKESKKLGLKPILRWKSAVIMLKTVEKGEYIGYGCSYKTKRKSVIATIPTGYADGFDRRLSNKGVVVINGKKAPIVGKICMDQFMVDVTDFNTLKVGDEVELIGEIYTVEDMAKDIGTISYEVVCSISKRVDRIYIG